MPNNDDFLGNDFSSELSHRIRYTDVDNIPDSDEKILTLKLDFPSVNGFKEFVSQGKEWSGSDRERQWLTDQVNKFDKSNPNSKINLTTITYKDTVYDERPMVVAIIRYTVQGA